MSRATSPPRAHPGRLIAGGFAGALAAGTLLLSLLAATAGPGRAGAVDALFTATSAVCVTGLAVVDTGTYWSWFGRAVILLLVQVGGLGAAREAPRHGRLRVRGGHRRLHARRRADRLEPGDQILVAGRPADVERFVETP